MCDRSELLLCTYSVCRWDSSMCSQNLIAVISYNRSKCLHECHGARLSKLAANSNAYRTHHSHSLQYRSLLDHNRVTVYTHVEAPVHLLLSVILSYIYTYIYIVYIYIHTELCSRPTYIMYAQTFQNTTHRVSSLILG